MKKTIKNNISLRFIIVILLSLLSLTAYSQGEGGFGGGGYGGGGYSGGAYFGGYVGIGAGPNTGSYLGLRGTTSGHTGGREGSTSGSGIGSGSNTGSTNGSGSNTGSSFSPYWQLFSDGNYYLVSPSENSNNSPATESTNSQPFVFPSTPTPPSFPSSQPGITSPTGPIFITGGSSPSPTNTGPENSQENEADLIDEEEDEPDEEPEIPNIYYFDGDDDGYHQFSIVSPVAPPVPGYKTSTLGIDCDDSDAEVGTCEDQQKEEEDFINEVLTVGAKFDQTNVANVKEHVPSDTDTYSNRNVKIAVGKTFNTQSVNNCVAHSLSFVGVWIKKNGVDNSEINKRIIANPKLGFRIIETFFDRGPKLHEAAEIVRGIYNTKRIELKKKDGVIETSNQALKRVIDRSNIVASFIYVNEIKQDPNNPNATITEPTGHAVVIVGYTQTGEYIYFDPAEGSFMTTDESSFNLGYRAILNNVKE